MSGCAGGAFRFASSRAALFDLGATSSSSFSENLKWGPRAWTWQLTPGRRSKNESGACYSAAPKNLGSWQSIKVAVRRKHLLRRDEKRTVSGIGRSRYDAVRYYDFNGSRR